MVAVDGADTLAGEEDDADEMGMSVGMRFVAWPVAIAIGNACAIVAVCCCCCCNTFVDAVADELLDIAIAC